MSKTVNPTSKSQAKLILDTEYEKAVGYFNAGNLPQADKTCSAIINEDPTYIDAFNLLGVIAQKVNRHDLAVELFERAIAVDNTNPLLYFNLGTSLNPLGRHSEAIASYQKSIAIKPGYANAHYYLGLAYLNLENLDNAVLSFKKAIAVNPGYVEAYCDLGYTQHLLGDSNTGVVSLKKAISLQENYVNAHYNLGVVLQHQSKNNEAILSYKNVIALTPEFYNAHYNIGVIYQAGGQIDEAILYFNKTLTINPDYPQAHYNLGSVLQEKRQIKEAILSYKSAINIHPDYAQAHSNLGAAMQELGKHDEAIACFKKAIEIEPDFAEAYYNYAYALQEHGEYTQAVAMYQKTIKCDPGYVTAHNNLIFCADLNPDFNSDFCYALRENWNKVHAEPLRAFWPALTNKPEPKRKLRIGYVSADFHDHSASHIFGPVLFNHDANNFQIFCYAGNAIEDDFTEQFKKISTRWLSTVKMDDATLAKEIQKDKIDILVDLSGHTSGNRLLCFARKAAPIQIMAWGYPKGTSMAAMDYIFADSVFIPYEERKNYTEQIVDLSCMVHLNSKVKFPAISEPPACNNGYITFGAFNRIEKYSHELYKLWADILKQIPNAKLLIKTSKLDQPKRVKEIQTLFAQFGVKSSRLILIGKTNQTEHLEKHNSIDIMLDPFPHNGGMTTMEALRMGVPVLTCEGRSIGPVSSSILHCLKLDEWRATNEKDYIDKAIYYANNIEMLKKLRAHLRSRFDESVLWDAQLYTKEIETIYRQLWVKWCEANK
ncbi:MAG: tetratricopeptide repeat protein [Magnetococcales bacterium]|nr:tetratricopeptide repeat protein [Magnetococcales bacterium]